MSEQLQLHFDKPGLFTTVQDRGRLAHQASGVPLSGALDRHAADLANLLVGNPAESSILEITLMGPKITFAGEGLMALTGADLSAQLNGKECPRYKTTEVRSGDVLHFGRARQGCRAYLGVRGRWLLPRWLSSTSAITQNGTQLTPWAIVQKGQVISIENPMDNFSNTVSVQVPSFSSSPTLRVVPGPEFDYFSRFVLGRFFSTLYTISPAANRMGYRLKERLEGFTVGEELISSGIIPGTIQVTNEGQPIVLLADAQTTGGYYRLANVIRRDLDLLAQLKPGDQLRFSLLSFEEAEQLL